MRFDYKNINNNKLLNILRYQGVVHLLKRIIYRLIFQPLITSKKNRSFSIGPDSYPYFYHSYNTTFINERAVEIPYFRGLVDAIQKRGGTVLEIGNVLSHYQRPTWDIVDKYERAEGVVNVDISDFTPPYQYDCIIAISTFEHVGFDEYPQNPEKVLSIIQLIRERLLKPDGELVFSVPVGYNSFFEDQMYGGKIGVSQTIYMRRVNWLNDWEQVREPAQVKGLPYDLFPHGLVIAHCRK